MKNIFRVILVIFGLMFAQFVQAAQSKVTFNVVVLPVDLFKVCANYYCFPEVSEILATDIIDNFNKTGRIHSPSLYYVRRTLEGNSVIKNYTQSVLTRFKNNKTLDFTALKGIAKTFNANSVLLISNDVPVEGAYARRNYWEMLVLSTNFGISYPYEMETRVVLVDTVNDLAMWSNVYRKKISDNNNSFKAPNASDAAAKLEYLKMYSADVLAKSIAQNIYLRFFPKVVDPQPLVEDMKTDGAYFRYENTPSIRPKLLEYEDKYQPKDDFGEVIDDNYGETIFSL